MSCFIRTLAIKYHDIFAVEMEKILQNGNSIGRKQEGAMLCQASPAIKHKNSYSFAHFNSKKCRFSSLNAFTTA
jgi:hypothetical protein